MNLKARIGPVIAVAAVTALVTSMVIGGGVPSAAAAPRPDRPAVPEYYMALPGGDNFANVPGSRTAVVGDTFTGKRLVTVHASGTDKFVTVAAADDDRTFVLGGNPDPAAELPGIASATDWYVVHFTPGATPHATIRKLHIPAPGKDDFVSATALSPHGTQVAVLGVIDTFPKPPVEWLRVYSVTTGALLHAWSGPLDVDWDGYATLSWTDSGRGLAIGYTFTVTPPGSKKSWEYLGVRTLDARQPGDDLIADSRLVWARLTRGSWFTSPVPLNCALDIRVMVSADGTVVCAADGLLRVYNPKITGPTCPAVPKWASLGFVAYPTTGSDKQVRTVFEFDTNCLPGGDDVLWTSAAGDTVIGWYALGEPFPGSHQTVRFGAFGDGRYTPLPMPLTTSSVPQTIAW